MQATTGHREGRPFDRRAFACAMMTLTGLALPVSGYANHLLQFDPLTPWRHAWMGAHTGLGVSFTVFAAWHVVLNRRALARHLSQVARGAPAISREALCALALVLFTTVLAAGHAFLVR